MDLVSWGAEPSIVRDRGVWRRAGAAIGRLGARQDVGRGASSESVTLARHVSDNFVDFLQLHQMTLLVS